MDFETAVRERLPILSILSNNFSMAIELKVMPVSTEKYRSTDISGNYADFAKALGGYGERVTEPGQIKAAIKRGIAEDPAKASRRCSNSSPRRRSTFRASPDNSSSLRGTEGDAAISFQVRIWQEMACCFAGENHRLSAGHAPLGAPQISRRQSQRIQTM